MKVAVLGAGISGLAAGWQLQNLSHDVTVYESSGRAGGKIKTDRVDGYLLELGPHAIMPSYTALHDALPQLGLMDSYIEAGAEGRNRFICLGGRPVPLPMGPGSLLATPLLSARAKLRLLKEPFVAPVPDDESVAAFFTRRLGPEVATRLIDPFISGVYAGDPDKLSVASALPMLKGFERESGSIMRGALKKMRSARKNSATGEPKAKRRRNMYSFEKGLSQMTDALAEQFGGRLLLGTPVADIEKQGQRWSVNGEPYDAVISTVPATSWAALNGNLFPQKGPQYCSVTVVHLAYPKSAVTARTDGFGMLIPAVEKRKILGLLFDSSLFPGRAPDDQHLFTIFMGGTRHSWTTAKSPEELTAIAQAEVADLMKIKGGLPPLFAHAHRWTHAIPQYDLGHAGAVKRMDDFEASHPNFVLAGNYRNGISVGHAFESGLDAVARLLPQMDR